MATGLSSSSPVHSRRTKLVRIAYLFIPLFSFLFTCICFIYPGTNLLRSFVTDDKGFISNIRVVHIRDLNFVLKSKIFIHTEG